MSEQLQNSLKHFRNKVKINKTLSHEVASSTPRHERYSNSQL
jgi:hypothetical protein